MEGCRERDEVNNDNEVGLSLFLSSESRGRQEDKPRVAPRVRKLSRAPRALWHPQHREMEGTNGKTSEYLEERVRQGIHGVGCKLQEELAAAVGGPTESGFSDDRSPAAFRLQQHTSSKSRQGLVWRSTYISTRLVEQQLPSSANRPGRSWPPRSYLSTPSTVAQISGKPTSSTSPTLPRSAHHRHLLVATRMGPWCGSPRSCCVITMTAGVT